MTDADTPFITKAEVERTVDLASGIMMRLGHACTHDAHGTERPDGGDRRSHRVHRARPGQSGGAMSEEVDLQEIRIRRAGGAVMDAMADHLGFDGNKMRTDDVALTLIHCLVAIDEKVPGFSRKIAAILIKAQNRPKVLS